MDNIILGASGRAALREAISQHPNNGLNTALASKEELLNAAQKLGIDASQFGTVRPARVSSAAFVPQHAPQMAVTGGAVVALRQAPVVAKHTPKLVEQKTVKAVFGLDIKGADGKPLMVDIWDSPDAPKVNPKYRWKGRREALRWLIVAQAAGMPLFLAGPPGTGKTSCITQFAARTGRPLVRINLDSGIERYELIGGERVRNGNVIFQDGVLTQALRIPGCIILLDEIGFARPEYASALHAVLEQRGALTIVETGEVVEPAPGVMICAADNSTGTAESAMQFAGVREQNRAMIDRWIATVTFGYLEASEEAALLAEETGLHPKAANYLLAAVNAIRMQAVGGAIAEPPSWRRVYSWGFAVAQGIPVGEAFEKTLVTRQDSGSAAELLATFGKMVNADHLDYYLRGEDLPTPDNKRGRKSNDPDDDTVDPAF